MDMKLELVAVPVTDVDRAKAFYVDQVGFNADHDHRVSDTLRFVQLTPPGSGCSIVIGTGITEMTPGSQQGLQLVVDDVGPSATRYAPVASRPPTLTTSRGADSSSSAIPTGWVGDPADSGGDVGACPRA
jgi:catechol 2,3-dioxygenase-like lactoylglutathione lyase family enzyme